MISKKPKLIQGGISTDERGSVSFINDFDFKGVKRFYVIENSSLDVIRAFHGHIKEEKYIFIASGKALVIAIEMDDIEKPSKNKEPFRFILSTDKPTVLYIPGGYVNGIKSLEENTKIVIFSTATLDESKTDDYRFPYDYWGKDVWKI